MLLWASDYVKLVSDSHMNIVFFLTVQFPWEDAAFIHWDPQLYIQIQLHLFVDHVSVLRLQDSCDLDGRGSRCVAI